MTNPSPSSVFVRYVHHLFCESAEKGDLSHAGIEAEQVKRLQGFKNNLVLWNYCHWVLEQKRSMDLERSYLDVREDMIQKLLRLRKGHRELLDAQVRQLDHIEEVILGLEERKSYYAIELDRYRSQHGDETEKLKKLEARLLEFEEELSFRQNVLMVQMELAQSKFPNITQLEEELESLEKSVEVLTETCLDFAKKLGLDDEVAKTLFYYLLNDGYFTYISQEDWHALMNRCSSKEQSWLREHFSEESKSKAWRLNDEQHYTSPLKRRCLVGSRDSSGISFVDFNIKKLLDEKLPHLTFTRYQNEVRTFYASMCNEALEDGILTVEEAKMMGELSETLKLDPFQARQIMNQEALRVQKDFVNQNLASFYELAMSDGNLHREEARFIVEMKTKLEGEVVENVSQMIQHMDENGIRLKMEDELFFIELCRLALKDQRLDECEMDLLKSFVEKKGWEESKLLELLEQAKLS